MLPGWNQPFAVLTEEGAGGNNCQGYARLCTFHASDVAKSFSVDERAAVLRGKWGTVAYDGLADIMRWPLKRKLNLFHGQRGIGLVESLIAVAILAAIGVVYVSSLTTAYRGVGLVTERIEAESLARSQLDAILASPYADSYTPIADIPQQYVISITVQAIDTPTCQADGNCNTLQEITVSISRPTGGGGNKPVLAVSTYKGKR